MTIQIFENENFGQVRTVEKDGQPWFIATDIAKALGYEKPNNAMNTHCKKINKISYPETGQPVNIIPESDVYRLIMRSNLPSAIDFQDWIMEIVLPAIRKTGGYIAGEESMDADEIMARAILMADKKIKDLEAKMAIIGPKSECYDRIGNSEGLFTLQQAAKVLQEKPNLFCNYLRAEGWIYNRGKSTRNLAYQDKVDAGLMKHKTVSLSGYSGKQYTTDQPLITARGMSVLAMKLHQLKFEGM